MAKRISLKGSQDPWNPATQVLPRLRSFSLYFPGFFMCLPVCSPSSQVPHMPPSLLTWLMSLHLPLGLIPWLCVSWPAPQVSSQAPVYVIPGLLTCSPLIDAQTSWSRITSPSSGLFSFTQVTSRALLHVSKNRIFCLLIPWWEICSMGMLFRGAGSQLCLQTCTWELLSVSNKLGWGTRCPGMLEQHILLHYIIATLHYSHTLLWK